MAYIRGSNPVWSFVDLTGKQLDDTFYMFVLQNTLPYLPEIVWHDPNGSIEWTSPIQFLANGTLPTDIYYDDGVVYRLEIRQGNTQQDPLIYLVENYVPGSNGNTPIDEGAFTTDNQITNPQFSLINFISPFAQTNVTNQTINVAPGWFLDLTGTGNVTVTQLPLNNSAANPTNASYALNIQLNGSWTTAALRQRFFQNGMLWANMYVSSSITALIQGEPQAISAILVDSLNNVLAEVLPSTPLNETFNEYNGFGLLGNTVNTDIPPNAYIDYRLILPTSVNITLTSIQLISGDLPVAYSYEQTTIQRQIDQTYNTAYPIVPVGAIIEFGTFSIPTHYFLCDGTAYNRITYNQLFEEITKLETVSLTASTNTFTVVSSTDYRIGMSIEGIGIPAATTITNIVGTTITMSMNATMGVTTPVRFFAWFPGVGDGSTTFNVPNLLDYVTAGANGTLFGSSRNSVGGKGGSSTHTQTTNEMPSHNHSGLFTFAGISAPPGSTRVLTDTPANTGNTGGGSPFSIVQLTALTKKCIRYE